MKRKRLFIPAGLFLAIAALAAVVFLVRASADDLLQQAATLLADAQDVHAVVSFEVETPEKSAVGTAEVWARRPATEDGDGAFRIEVLETDREQALGATAVSDGQQFWLWAPSRNTVYVGTRDEMKTHMAEYKGQYGSKAGGQQGEFDGDHSEEGDFPQTPVEAVEKLLEYFDAEREGVEDVAGAAGNHIRLIPIPDQMPEEVRANGGLVNIWLRTTDNAPLAAEYAGGAVGYGKVTATLLELNQGLDEGLFTFDIPAGAEVVNLADLEWPQPEEGALSLADADILSPADLPGGARPAGVYEMRGAIVQRFRLPDGESFTVAQGPSGTALTPDEEGQAVTVNGAAGTLYAAEDGARTLLIWTEDDISFAIGGDLTPDQALAVAQSLQ